MAHYNQWMNGRLYEAAARLSHESLIQDRQAFFGSILGTLNHLVVADTIWLQRFAQHPTQGDALAAVCELPAPAALNQLQFAELSSLWQRRTWLDQFTVQWVAQLTEADLAHVLRYANTKGMVSHKSFFSLLMHVFNHQTHHRGQATTLLTQAGVDVGLTDLLAVIPNEQTD